MTWTDDDSCMISGRSPGCKVKNFPWGEERTERGKDFFFWQSPEQLHFCTPAVLSTYSGDASLRVFSAASAHGHYHYCCGYNECLITSTITQVSFSHPSSSALMPLGLKVAFQRKILLCKKRFSQILAFAILFWGVEGEDEMKAFFWPELKLRKQIYHCFRLSLCWIIKESLDQRWKESLEQNGQAAKTPGGEGEGKKVSERWKITLFFLFKVFWFLSFSKAHSLRNTIRNESTEAKKKSAFCGAYDKATDHDSGLKLSIAPLECFFRVINFERANMHHNRYKWTRTIVQTNSVLARVRNDLGRIRQHFGNPFLLHVSCALFNICLGPMIATVLFCPPLQGCRWGNTTSP